MGTVVKTATTPNECGCCGEPTPPCVDTVLECRLLGGIATMVGFSELTLPSVPPKKYRISSMDGYAGSCFQSPTPPATGCTGTFNPANTTTYVRGACIFDKDTGLQIASGEFGVTSGPVCGTIGAYTDHLCDPFSLFLWYCGVQDDDTLTQTYRKSKLDPACYATPSQGFCHQIGIIERTLSDEDTEQDAINRLINASTWSAWTSCGGVPPACCFVNYELRVTGFSFSVVVGQFRCTATGLEGGKRYSTSVKAYRRLIGSSEAFTLYGTINLTAIADSGGGIEFDGDIPNEPGFETYVVSSPCGT